MARLSKYFTPAIEDGERLLFTKILGLEQCVFQLAEEFDGQQLIVQNWSNHGASTQITDVSVGREVKYSCSSSGPEVIVQHLSFIGDLQSQGESQGLFEQVLNYPYKLFFREDTNNLKIRFLSPEFSCKIQQLKESVSKLEAELANSELSILWARGSGNALPLLFHFVRKKLIRVGTLGSLKELADDFGQGKLTPAHLRQFFGTQAAFFELNLDLFSHLDCPIERLKSSVNRCLTDPDSRVLGGPIHFADSSSYLDFEL